MSLVKRRLLPRGASFRALRRGAAGSVYGGRRSHFWAKAPEALRLQGLSVPVASAQGRRSQLPSSRDLSLKGGAQVGRAW